MILILLMLACTSDGDDSGTAGTSPPDWTTCTTLLSPGSEDDREAVQTAFIEAADGAELCLDEGTWTFDTELSISVAGITLRGAGMGRTVLDFATQDVGPNGLTLTGDNTTVEDLTVLNTPGDGIRATDVDGITFRRVQVGWDADGSFDNGAYGLYPVGCNNVLIDDSEVYGARDAGIYVGQSTNILVKNSRAWANVAGIEIENSTDAEVTGCTATDNTSGILVFNLPGLPVQDGKRAKIHGNTVTDNNRESFAEPGTVVSILPPGMGILVLSSDNNEIHDNTISGNKSAGVVLLSYLEDLMGSWDDKAFDPYPENNWVHDNTFVDNGLDPDPLVGLLVPKPRPVPAILWDGCENTDDKGVATPAGNCVDGDAATGWMDIGYCGEAEVNPTVMVCEGTALGNQNP